MLIGQQIGPFVIEKELGSGAMGTVYRARFQKSEEKVVSVALKMVALGLLGNEGAMARFDREANILKQLKHPHIVRLLATGSWRKTPFIAMEYIDGEALDRVLARRGRLSWEEVTAYGKQLCDALQHAHEKGIIHRDLKPSNLMITREGVLKLTDFGIAKDTDVTALTGMNSTIGTAAYMSPEQCKGDKNLTHKSDLYSLGIVFFELLSGRKPFTADTTVDMFLKHVNERPPRVDKVVQELPPKLSALILQLLEKDREDRPLDAAWVGRMLAEIEDDAFARKSAGLEAVTARRGSRPKGSVGPIDEEDREAARALKGKKKKKKKSAPLLQQTWLKAVALSLALVGLGVTAYLLLRPASAETLIARMDEAKKPEDRLAAAEKYLKEYGGRPGEQTDKAAAVFREETARKQEDVLKNRFGNKNYRTTPPENEDPKAYAGAIAAIEAEKDGKLKDAATGWTAVKNVFPEEAKLPFTLDEDTLRRARWGWLADKRLADLKQVETTLARLRAEIRDMQEFETPLKLAPGSPDAVATKALRLEAMRDQEKAARLWDSLQDLAEKDPAMRTWSLLAAQQRANLPQKFPDPSSTRAALVTEHLNEAANLIGQAKADPNLKKERHRGKVICREVIDLYDDDEKGRDQLGPAIDRAKLILRDAG